MAEDIPAVHLDPDAWEAARLRCPLAAVMKDTSLVGVITASRLLQLALAHR